MEQSKNNIDKIVESIYSKYEPLLEAGPRGQGRIRDLIIMMAKYIGYPLPDWCEIGNTKIHVHHVDGNNANHTLDNISLVAPGEHSIKSSEDWRLQELIKAENIVLLKDIMNRIELRVEKETEKENNEEHKRRVYEKYMQSTLIKESQDYKMRHTVSNPDDEYGAWAYNLDEMIPSDWRTHPEQYTGFSQWVRKVVNQLKRVDGNAEGELIIYRALPKSYTEINSGDWVTLSPEYARMHGESYLEDDYHIIEKKIKAKELAFGGDDLMEWGYFKA